MKEQYNFWEGMIAGFAIGMLVVSIIVFVIINNLIK